CTIKYDRNGNQIWSRIYDSGRDDEAYDVAVDSLDNIIVTGYITNANEDFCTIKYDRNGNQIWSRIYDSGITDWAWGVAVDSHDNVIVTGQRRDGVGSNYYTIKYNTDGNEIWSQDHDVGMCEVFDVAVDSQDNVIVTGQCGFPSGKYHTIKYDKDGNRLWVAIYGIPGDNEGKAVAVDSQDNVIVTGISGPQINWGYLFGWCTIKYDRNGDQIWSKTYTREIDDWAWGVVADSQYNVIATGLTTIVSGNEDYYIIKYDRNGDQIWSQIYDSGGNDSGQDVAVDSQDNIIVTGFTTNASGNEDYYTIKIGRPPLPAPLPAPPAPPTPPTPPAPRASPSPQTPTRLPPADIRVHSLAVSPGETQSGQPVTVLANVVNNGVSSGSYNVALRVNGRVEQQRTVEVSPGTAYPVRFTVTKSQPGTYTVNIGNQRGSFTVIGPGEGSNTGAGVGLAIAAAVLLLGLLLIVITKRLQAS
ncbi:MAG: hypothetical protein KAT75_11195, partial [Dehalococcoidia bacterium]|nr:hypothetical protein [Dehalococcoidia bacterium]